MKKLIVVSDWASDPLSSQEFKSVVEGFLREPNVDNIGFVSSTPSTIHTAFLTSQLVETEESYGGPQETIVFQNTDPRLEKSGAKFIIVRLKSGLFVCGPNAGYNFSLIKSKIDELYHYSGFENKTQFRSKDLFARICAHLIDEMEDELDLEEGPTDIIPELRGKFVGHIDSFGNIKTTITHEDLKGKYDYGEKILIQLNNIKREAIFTESLFAADLGTLVIYPGSSGPKNNRYLEISAWSHFNEGKFSTGSFAFGNPLPGMEIIVH